MRDVLFCGGQVVEMNCILNFAAHFKSMMKKSQKIKIVHFV